MTLTNNVAIPQEIFDLVIDMLAGNTIVLRQCGLVCWAWSVRSQHHLFRHISLDTRHSMQPPGSSPAGIHGLLSLLDSTKPRFPVFVQEISYYNPHYQHVQTSHDWEYLVPLLQPLGWTHALRLKHTMLSFGVGLLTTNTFPHLRELVLDFVGFENSVSAAYFLGSIVNLEALTIRSIHFRGHHAGKTIPILVYCGALRSLVVGFEGKQSPLLLEDTHGATERGITHLEARYIQTSEDMKHVIEIIRCTPFVKHLAIDVDTAYRAGSETLDLSRLSALTSLRIRWGHGNPYPSYLPRWLSTITGPLEVLDIQNGDVYGFYTLSTCIFDSWASLEETLECLMGLKEVKVMLLQCPSDKERFNATATQLRGVLKRWDLAGILQFTQRVWT